MHCRSLFGIPADNTTKGAIQLSAFTSADILLPKDIDFTKWAVVACDQYTSQPQYWEEAEKLCKDSLTALDLILPEIYLGSSDVADRIKKIHANMYGYLDGGIFEEYKDSLIYIERTQDDGRIRQGLIGAVDLEAYDYSKGSQSPVRATEATVPSRLPPRVRIRSGAPIELPHIMLLTDNKKKDIIEPLADKKDEMKKLYDFELMLGGGRAAGWLLSGDLKAEVLSKLDSVSDQMTFNKRYHISGMSPLVFAMGDGNHSLAAAKAFYEQLKEQNPDKDMSSHPARYALAELVNLHSDALEFEAIHRIVTGVDEDKFISELALTLGLSAEGTNVQYLTIVRGSKERRLSIGSPTSKLAVGSLQNFLDNYIEKNGGSVDYIHGEDTVRKLAEADGAVGFVLPDMKKGDLFPTVIADGALPRKTFSMGHAWDKRYYIEARKIAE